MAGVFDGVIASAVDGISVARRIVVGFRKMLLRVNALAVVIWHCAVWFPNPARRGRRALQNETETSNVEAESCCDIILSLGRHRSRAIFASRRLAPRGRDC